jgi:tRNA (cytidine/uridine-2'-O-)-methyltransferase
VLNIVLFEPEIPPNTGNIIRLASNTGCHLHLVHPLGFTLEDKALRRAGLDYHEYCNVQQYANWSDFLDKHDPNLPIWGVSTKGTQNYCEVDFEQGSYLLFGPETRGLPDSIRQDTALNGLLRLPMLAQSRSLNLSNSVAILVYEAWRQMNFTGAQ